MNRKTLRLLATAAILTCSCFGEVLVTTEQVNPADPAWNFKTIPRPSKSDLASGATISLLGNQPEPAAGQPSVLLNGVLPADSLDLSEEALFSNSDPADGQILIDLGRAQPIAVVTTYSWHEWDVDGGSRAPLVYTLYASAAAAPDPKNLATWTKIAQHRYAAESHWRKMEWATRGLPQHEPYVEVGWRVTEKTPDPLPEGGWLCLPCAVKEPQFRLGRLAGPMEGGAT